MTVLQGNPLLRMPESTGDDYTVAKSCRFNEDFGGNGLKWKATLDGNKRVHTLATWFKILPGSGSELWGGGTPEGSDRHGLIIRLYQNGGLDIRSYQGGAYDWQVATSGGMDIDDTSAWTHVVITLDSRHTVSTERIKAWINGKQVTFNSPTDFPSKNYEFRWNAADTWHGCGVNIWGGVASSNTGNSMHGYLADPYHIDGLALGPAAFGKYNNTGVWVPKQFAIPAPNDGTTWSSADTIADWDTNYGVTRMFDGDIGTQTMATTYANSHGTIAWNTPIEFTTSLRLYVHMDGRTNSGNPWIKVTTDKGVIRFNADQVAGDGNEVVQWLTIKEGPGSFTKIESQTGINTGYGNSIRAVEVDGVILVDGYQDTTTFNNINRGQKWSDNVTGSGTVSNAASGFNGNWESTYCHGGEFGAGSLGDKYSKITFTPGITVDKFVGFMFWDTDHRQSCRFNDTGSWYTIPAVNFDANVPFSGTLTSITISTADGGRYAGSFNGITIDGVPLLDESFDNSWHLDFNSSAYSHQLGNDVFHTKVEDADTKPILATTDDFGNTKGSGYTSDSNAGTTDGTGLIFAVAGDTLTDIHAGINTGSSNNTINVDSGGTTEAAVSTLDSKYYGSSIKFDGMGDCQLVTGTNADFTLGTNDFTVEFWYKQLSRDTSGSGHSGGLFRISEADFSYAWEGNFHISVSHEGALNVAFDQSKTLDGTAGDVGLYQWHHIAVTKQSNLQILYIDGIERGRTTHTGIDIDEGDRIVLGNYTNHRNSILDGYMQDVRLYRGVVKYTQNFDPGWSNNVEPINRNVDGTGDIDGGALGTTSVAWSGYADTGWEDSTDWDDLGSVNIGGGGGTGQGYSDAGTYSIPAGGYYSNKDDWGVDAGGSNGWAYKFSSAKNIKWKAPAACVCKHASATSTTYGSATSMGTLAANDVVYMKNVLVLWVSWTGPSYPNLNGAMGTIWAATQATSGDIDVLSDSPSNNFCTLSPTDYLGRNSSKVTNGGLTDLSCTDQSGWAISGGTMSVPSNDSDGWYYEATLADDQPHAGCGWYDVDLSGIKNINQSYKPGDPSATAPANDAGTVYQSDSITSFGDGNISTSSTIGQLTSGDTVGVAMKNNKLYWARNNTWTGDPTAETNPAITLSSTRELVPLAVSLSPNGASQGKVFYNFGQRPFKYTPPSGFKTLCAENLPDTFSGDDANHTKKFHSAHEWRGTDGDFQFDTDYRPEFFMMKSRDGNTWYHNSFDIVNGSDKGLHTNINYSLQTHSNQFTFNSDNVTVSQGGNEMNNKSKSYQGNGWDAGTSAATASTEGNITPSAQWVNNDAGFSITKWTGVNGTTKTIGHGLNATPELIIIKCISAATDWRVYHKSLGEGHYIALNTNTAPVSDTTIWNNTAPTSTIFTVGDHSDVNSSEDYIAYIWTPIRGFSKFGKYKGQDYVHLGFKPATLIIKDGDDASYWWWMNNAVNKYNINASTLAQNPATDGTETNVENGCIDWMANGFHIRSSGGSIADNNMLYMAWAEHPFKTARAN